jgi:hypothetical protein
MPAYHNLPGIVPPFNAPLTVDVPFIDMASSSVSGKRFGL